MAEISSPDQAGFPRRLGLYFFVAYASHFYFHLAASGVLFWVVAAGARGVEPGLVAVGAVVAALCLFWFDLMPRARRVRFGVDDVWRLIGPHGLVALACAAGLAATSELTAKVALVGAILALVSPAHGVGIAILRDNTCDYSGRLATHSLFGLLGTAIAAAAIGLLLVLPTPTAGLAVFALGLLSLAAMAITAVAEARSENTPALAVTSRPRFTAQPGPIPAAVSLLILSDLTFYAAHGVVAATALNHEPALILALFCAPLAGAPVSERISQCWQRSIAIILLAAGPMVIVGWERVSWPTLVAALVGPSFLARTFVLDYANRSLEALHGQLPRIWGLVPAGGVAIGAAIAVMTARSLPLLLAIGAGLSALQFLVLLTNPPTR